MTCCRPHLDSTSIPRLVLTSSLYSVLGAAFLWSRRKTTLRNGPASDLSSRLDPALGAKVLATRSSVPCPIGRLVPDLANHGTPKLSRERKKKIPREDGRLGVCHPCAAKVERTGGSTAQTVLGNGPVDLFGSNIRRQTALEKVGVTARAWWGCELLWRPRL